MERSESNTRKGEKNEQFLNKQNTSFQSEIVEMISIKHTILEVTILKQDYRRCIKTKENIFANYFEGTNFDALLYLCLMDMRSMILPRINVPLLEKIQISFVVNLSLNQFAQGNYPSLKIIKAQYNNLSELPQLSGCQSIQQLYFKSNRIKSIEIFSKGSYPFLKILDLTGNQIREVYEIDATNLENLYLNANRINSIDKLIEFKYQKLKIISLWKNKLKSVPFINAPNLQTLQVGNNQFQQLNQFYSGSIAKYERLQIFQCTSSKLIKQIPRFLTLKNTCSLRILNLSECMIENIQILSQIELNRIKQIDLSKNKIVSFKIFHKLKLSQVHRIQLKGNLSYRRDFMNKCQINGGLICLWDSKQEISIYQDTGNGGYSLSWLLKYKKENVRIQLILNIKQLQNLNSKLKQVMERKKAIRFGYY